MARPEPIKQYDDVTATIKGQLTDIALMLKAHKVRAKDRPHDWGFVGDLRKIEHDLAAVLEFLQSK